MRRDLPLEVLHDLARAKRLEWWTLAWMSSVVIVMWLVTGSSQAMKAALVEDVLSLIPAIVFLIAAHCEAREPTSAFPFGLERVHSLAALIAAVALTAVGGFLLFEAGSALIHAEHPTIEPVELFGQTVWLGWIMIAALAYSVVPPVILGHLKQPIAKRLQDEVLETDATMQRADWMTGLAGIGGILGIAFGFWWADAVAAAIISTSIVRDGVTSLRVATAELVDGSPRALGKTEIAEDAQQLISALNARYPGARVRLRETGRYIHAEVSGVPPDPAVDIDDVWPGDPDRSWRLAQISFVPRNGTRAKPDIFPKQSRRRDRRRVFTSAKRW